MSRVIQAAYVAVAASTILLVACSKERPEGGATLAATAEKAPPAPATNAAVRPNYWQDIGPLFRDKCIDCHGDATAAGFVLSSYDHVLARASMVRHAVAGRHMPPWGIESGCGTFDHDPGLAADQVALVTTWIDNGMPEGDPRSAPPPTPRKELVQPLAGPLTTLSFGQGYEPGPGDAIDRCFLVEGADVAAGFVTGLSLPRDAGLRQVTLFAVDTDSAADAARALDAADAEPGFRCPTQRLANTRVLASVTSGEPVLRLPSGTGFALTAKQRFIAQTQFEILFSDRSIRRGEISLLVEANARPARWVEVRADASKVKTNERAATIEEWSVIQGAGQVYGVYPFMRRLATSLQLRIDRPEGRGRRCMIQQTSWQYPMLRVPRFYTSPIPLEAGSLGVLSCRYNTLEFSAVAAGVSRAVDEECAALLYLVD